MGLGGAVVAWMEWQEVGVVSGAHGGATWRGGDTCPGNCGGRVVQVGLPSLLLSSRARRGGCVLIYFVFFFFLVLVCIPNTSILDQTKHLEIKP